MSARGFDEEENEQEDYSASATIATEANPSTKLERRRKIEELQEEKLLREELAEFG
ncbi:PA3496 family putative envelope integrity protein [Legionella rowbothamii]|uniref:PA3496 family putative envelope integrity protein n=1 Tax=Legionella rowbothamii TaxID=96229 RepID=UPI0013EF93B5|nr:hypothetical protein [Legionella rowbothamii]